MKFIDDLRALMSMNEDQLAEVASSPDRRKAIEAVSGGNVNVGNATYLSDSYKNALTDAIRFYQNEFKVSPHANVRSFVDSFTPDELGDIDPRTRGMTTVNPDRTGQHDIALDDLTSGNEEKAEEETAEASETGWHPKNSIGIANVPVHEFGHAIAGMLFEDNANEDRKLSGYSEKNDQTKVVKDALRDIGADVSDEGIEISSFGPFKEGLSRHTKKLSKNYDIARDAVKEISDYALTNPAEAIAESLVDYYYNRDNAASLSKAIVNRLKSEGSMYGIKQTGAVDLAPSADNLLSNLRRYRVIQ